MAEALGWIAALPLAGLSYLCGLYLGKRWRAHRRRFLAASAGAIIMVGISVLFLTKPALIAFAGLVFGLQMGMRHAYGPLATLVGPQPPAVTAEEAEAGAEEPPAT